MSVNKNQKQPELKSLFHERNLNTKAMSLWDWLIFLVYLPFGCVLSVFRIILGFIIALLAPCVWRKKLLRFAGMFIIKSPKFMEMPENGTLLLSNHSSYLDYIVISAGLKPSRDFATVIWHQVEWFVQVFCRPVVHVLEAGQNRHFLREIRDQLKQRNVIIFPEGAITDARSGLLSFEKSAFALKTPIYLVAIKYHRPFAFLQPKALSTHLAFEMAVELFQPWTTVEVKNIGEFPKLEGETAQGYAERAQQAVADELGLAATSWTRSDRHQLLFPESSAE